MTDAEKTTLQALEQRLAGNVQALKTLSEMSDTARVAAGLSIEPSARSEELAIIRALETFALDVRNVIQQLINATSVCQAWIEIAGGRLTCELPVAHDGSHRKQLIGRADKQRIDAEITWQMAPYLQAL